MTEVDEMVNTRAARFANADELFAEIEEASDRQASQGATCERSAPTRSVPFAAL